MRALVLFLTLAAGGVALLLHLAGGLRTTPRAGVAPPRPTPVRPAAPHPRIAEGHTLPVPTLPVHVPAAHGVMVPAEAEVLAWQDATTGETVRIPFFFRWRFTTKEVRGLQPEDADRQGALCLEPVLEVFREPLTREEALALRAGEPGAQDALLSHRFSADEAQVLGHLAQRLERRTPGTAAGPADGVPDSTVHLRGRVRVLDLQRGLEINARGLTVYPREERAEGEGPVAVRHAAFVLDGEGLSIERDARRGWSRVELHRRVVLRLREQALGEDGTPILTLPADGMRPSHVTADGRTVVVHEKARREQLLRLRFTDGVRAEENAGGSLDARNLALELTRPDHALAGALDAGQWRLRELVADGDVRVAWPPARRGVAGLRSARSERLVHLVPPDEPPTTTLEGRSLFVLEGDDLLGGLAGASASRIRVSCEDRAWIGPAAPEAAAEPSRARPRRRLMLRGRARIEHHALGTAPAEDLIEAQEVDFLVEEAPGTDGAAPRTVPVRIAAVGDVRLGGTRLRGRTHRIVVEGLDGPAPTALIEGPETEIYFLALGGRERLLGGPAPTADDGREPGTPPPARWHLERVLAQGAVRVDTSLGGPTLGAPVRVTCSEATYERPTGHARLTGAPGAPVRVVSLTPDGRDNAVQAETMTLDRPHGILTARGAVQAEMYLALSAGGGWDAEPLLPRTTPGEASELGVRTSARIEVLMAQVPRGGGPAPGREQRLRIRGPLRAELRGPQGTSDVLEAQALEVAMALGPPDAGPTSASGASAPFARATTGRATARGGSAAPAAGPARRVELRATEVRLDLEAGEVAALHARGGASLRMDPDLVEGDVLVYEALARRVRVEASAGDWRRRPASVRLGPAPTNSEAIAQRMELTFGEGGPSSVRLAVPPGDTGQLDVRLASADADGSLEWYSFTFWGEIVGRPERIETGRVRIARRLRGAAQGEWSAPLALWSDASWVEGQNLLSPEGRRIDRAVAEGERTTVQTGEAGDRIWAWGRRFAYEAATGRARLTAAPGAEVTIQREGREKNQTLVIEIDMRSGVPVFMDGPRILWGPR